MNKAQRKKMFSTGSEPTLVAGWAGKRWVTDVELTAMKRTQELYDVILSEVCYAYAKDSGWTTQDQLAIAKVQFEAASRLLQPFAAEILGLDG